MLSRVADSLYWMSRYIERADGILRMLKINYASSQEDVQEFSWKPVLRIFTYLDEEKANLIAHHSRAALQFMVTDRDNPNSVVNIVTHARENARSVQDHITKELWQCLNDYYHAVREEHLLQALNREDPITVLDELIKQGVLYYGTIEITMARGEGYAFINIGKFLERCVQTADILQVKFGDVNYDFARMDTTYWRYLLLSISGYELYLKTYRGGFDVKYVVEQTVLNPDFPRSVVYSISQLHRYFSRLKSDKNLDAHNKIEFMIGKIQSKIKYSSVENIMKQSLHPFLNEVKEDVYDVGNALNHYYFGHV
ncbi:MAG: alpha-E domain-containing protein [Bacteroidetes bacterium]|nr:MAG: alpha-E domain-containing protein [Bacteroidota bacterium]